MKTALSKVGLLSQDIILGLSDSTFLVEQVEVPPIVRERVNVTVKPGTVAVLGGVKYRGQMLPYKLTRAVVASKGSSSTVYLLPDKMMDSITVVFFGGQHVVSISSLPSAKAKFSIVGSATVEIADVKELANYFKRSITKEDLVADINNNLRGHLSNEVSMAASKYITPETTEVTLRAALNDVAREVISSKKTASALMNMGLILSARGISMHINALEDAEDKIKLINDLLTDKAISSLDDDLLDRASDALAASRKHELDMTLAKNTTTRNINTNSNNTVTTNGNAPVADASKKNAKAADEPTQRFCMNCGAGIPDSTANFCPKCGKRL